MAGRTTGRREPARSQQSEEEETVVLRWEDLTEEQKTWVIAKVLFFLIFWARWIVLTPDDWKTWWQTLKTTAKELKTRLSTAYELTLKIIKLLFFLFQFLYPLILFLLDIKDLGYNITCLVVGFIGVLKDGWEVFREIRSLCRSDSEDSEELKEYDVENTTTTSSSTAVENDDEKIFRDHMKEVCLDIFEEVLIYPAIICDVYGFVNGEVYKYENGTDYVDTCLLAWGILLNLVDKQGRRIVLLYRTWKALCNAYPSAKPKGNCICCCGNGVIPWFIVQFAGLALVHVLLIMLVGIRCYYDNLYSLDYTTTTQSNTLIAAAVCLPLVSIIMYVLINKVWIVELFLNIKKEKDPSYKNKRLDLIAKRGGSYRKAKAPLADVKAIIFGGVWIYLVLYCAYASEIAPGRVFLPKNDTVTKKLGNTIPANDVIRMGLAVALFGSNVQTTLFSIYVTIVAGFLAVIASPIIVAVFMPPLLIFYVFACLWCCCTKKDCCTKTVTLIRNLPKAFWVSLTT